MALSIPNRLNIRPLHGALVRPYPVNTACQVGDAVALNGSNEIVPARANADGTTNAIGIVVIGDGYFPGTAIAAGQTAAVVVDGPVSGFSGMDVTLPVFVSAATAGVTTQTAPLTSSNRVFSIGRPLATDILMVRPQSTPSTLGA